MKTSISTFTLLVLLLGLSHPVRISGAATLSPGVSEIVRQLQEWRDVSSSWLKEATAAHPTNSPALRQLRAHYIQASAIANSLISQFQLETTARTPMNPKRYEPNVKRAQAACEAIAREARRLFDESTVKTRGRTNSTNTASATNDTFRLVFEGMDRSVGLAGGLLDTITKNRKAFLELDDKQRKEVNNLLEATKWAALDNTPARPQEAKK